MNFNNKFNQNKFDKINKKMKYNNKNIFEIIDNKSKDINLFNYL